MANYIYDESDSPKPVEGKEYIALIVDKRPEAINKKCVFKKFSEHLGYHCYFPDLNASWWVDEMKDVEEEKPVEHEMIIVDHTNKQPVKVGDACVCLDADAYYGIYGTIIEIDNDTTPFRFKYILTNTNPVTGEIKTTTHTTWSAKIGIYKTEQQVKIEGIKESVKELLKETALTQKQINNIISKIK